MNAQQSPQRFNIAIPWSKEHRDAFHRMAQELGAENSADLARQILSEVMLWYYGLEESKKLAIISRITAVLPAPNHALFISRLYAEKSNIGLDRLRDQDIKGAAMKELVEETRIEHRKRGRATSTKRAAG